MQHIWIKYPETLFSAEQITICYQRDCAAKQFFFFDDVNSNGSSAMLQELAHRFSVGVDIDKNFINAKIRTNIQPYLEHGNAADRQKAFGDFIGQRPQTCTMPGRQQEGFQL